MADSDTPGKIIASAITIFARDGFRGARMHQIATAAGVNQALLHYYFSSKEKLYEEALFKVFSQIFTQLSRHFSDRTSPQTAFGNFIHMYMDILKHNPEFPKLLIFEILEGGKHIIAVTDRIFSETGVSPPELIIPFIQKAVRKGLIRPVDPMQTMISIIGMCVFYFIANPLMTHIWGKPDDENAFIDERKEAIIDLVLYGITKQKAALKETAP
jgi:TetR/AcrR family transcriptional regulator